MPRIRARPDAPRFFEVDPKHTNVEFQTLMGRALDVLKKNPTSVSQRAHRAITRGEVKVDLLSDLTREDFRRVRKTLAGWGFSIPDEAYATLHDRRTRASRAITQNMRGYQWDNRIYVDGGLGPTALARVLVHEVNHVLNKSEEHYRGDKSALREEYRAALAERLFDGDTMTAKKCLALKKAIIALYGLSKASPDDVADFPEDRAR